jgi:hypothetical protein
MSDYTTVGFHVWAKRKDQDFAGHAAYVGIVIRDANISLSMDLGPEEARELARRLLAMADDADAVEGANHAAV